MAVVVAALASVMGFVALAGTAAAAVTADTGSAFGVSAPNITLFGGAQTPFGPVPTITLPSSGSATTRSATAKKEDVVYGPANFFSSGVEKVTTKGTTGATGSVVSTALVKAATQPAGTCPGSATACVVVGPFTATSAASNCKATQKALTGATTIVGGQLVTATDTNGNPTTTVTIPASPTANYTISGFLYASPTDKETFTFVFNQQTVSGSITVIAGHEELFGPTAKGDIYFGESVCGVTT
jgi:hypothetical protein